MVSFFGQLMKGALAALNTTHGAEVTYQPLVGDPVAMTGVLSAEQVSHEDSDRGRIVVRSRFLSLDGTRRLSLRGKVTIDETSEVWEIVDMQVGHGVVRYQIVIRQLSERTGPGYRSK